MLKLVIIQFSLLDLKRKIYKMKKILSLSLMSALLLGMYSCSKVNPKSNGSNHLGVTNPTGGTVVPVPVNPLGDMPSEFTRKAVIEEATAVWCGYCPNGAYYLNMACDNNPDKVYGVAYHQTDVFSGMYDAFTTQANTELSAEFNISGIPGGVVDRISTSNNYNSWVSLASSEIKKTATCGLAITTTKVDASYEIEVHAGFNTSLSGDYRLVVYVLEDEVHKGAAYDQHNYMDGDAGSPWEGKGDPMPASNFKHKHVFRQSLVKGMWGDPIDATKLKAGGEFVQKFTLDPSPEWDLTKTSVLAMIVNKGTSADKHMVENAQECELGKTKKWD